MSLLITLDRRKCSHAVAKLGSELILPFLCPAILSRTRADSRHPKGSPYCASRRSFWDVSTRSDLVDGLIWAGSCWNQQRRFYSQRNEAHLGLRNLISKGGRRLRSHETNRSIRTSCYQGSAAAAVAVDVSTEDLMGLVDFYNEPKANIESGTPSQEIGGHKTIDKTVRKGERARSFWRIAEGLAYRPLPVETREQQSVIDELRRLLGDEGSSHEIIYELYRSLSPPRICYLTISTARALVRHLMLVERKSEPAMLRYLSVIDDMKAAGIPIQITEYNTAMAFAGRFFGEVTTAEVQSAFHIWHEIEKNIDLQADHVTFGILMDVASRAGKFQLVDALFEQMRVRNLPVTRYLRVGRIYDMGLRRNGDGVRQAYAELVAAGEIVDTVVLNCVIAALIRAAEPAAAEQVFARMKELHRVKTGSPVPAHTWRERRATGHALDRAARAFRDDPDRRRAVQEAAAIAPDATTFGLLVSHHSITSGNLDRVMELLDEMQYMQMPVRGPIFYFLFRGFLAHGGVQYSPWTLRRLDAIWHAFLRVVDARHDGVFLSATLVRVVLEAYLKFRSGGRAAAAWGDARSRWEPTAEELDAILFVLGPHLPQDGVAEK